MTGDDSNRIIAFESSLKPGALVRVKWTWSYQLFSAKGKVVKVNLASIVTELLEPISSYPVGQRIKCPRLGLNSGSRLWSVNNRVEPVGGYQ